jgi:hypothetical protein
MEQLSLIPEPPIPNYKVYVKPTARPGEYRIFVQESHSPYAMLIGGFEGEYTETFSDGHICYRLEGTTRLISKEE